MSPDSKAVVKSDGEAAAGRKRAHSDGPGVAPRLDAGHVANMLGAVSALQQQERFELKPQSGLMGRRSPPRGGIAADALNQQILVSESEDDDGGAASVDLDDQARALLKAEKRAAKAARKDAKRRKLEQPEAFLRAKGIDPHAAAISGKASNSKHKKHKDSEKQRHKKSRKD